MGLYQSNFRFESGPPDLDVVRTEARGRLGSVRGIEALEVDGQILTARSMLDPFTHHVVCAILLEMGGQPVSLRDGSPVHLEVPPWARRPIREMPWRQRMAVRYGWWRWLLGGDAKS
jgi:hypothetical protein